MGVRHLLNNQRTTKEDEELREIVERSKTRIKVVGCGGAGNNTVTRLMQVGIVGAETIAINTDAMDLLYTDSDKKILIGRETTQGLGAGADPELGRQSAEENKNEIRSALKGANMVFLTAGLGGGSGTGSIPVVAKIAKRLGALTLAIVTLPFKMEGRQRMLNAEKGLQDLEGEVDTLIVVPNEKLLEVVPDVSLEAAFRVADEILVNAVKGTTELVTKPGLVNLDFADVKAVMRDGGLAMIGLGESDTENRAVEAVQKAINNPLIEVDISNAKGALVNVIGGPDLTMREYYQVVDVVSSQLSSDAKVISGAQIDKTMGDRLRALLIITGVESPHIFGGEKTWSKKRKKDIENLLGVEFVE